MSYTTIYKIDTDGDVIECGGIDDRFTLLIHQLMHIKWFRLIENLLEKPEGLAEDEPMTLDMIQLTGQMDAFWTLYRNMEVPQEHRLVFGSTFNYMTIDRDNFDAMISAYRIFMDDLEYCEEAFPFKDIKNLINIIDELKGDTDCVGFCMCPSFKASHWDVYSESGDYSAYNINKASRHSELFDETTKIEESIKQKNL
jgi:hypothetical protein|tara:strand:- start:462 stop:1055 length:594 start_codon:yes stop_codon:yes gene_type:complete